MASPARLRRDARSIFLASIEAAQPRPAIARHLRRDGETLRILTRSASEGCQRGMRSAECGIGRRDRKAALCLTLCAGAGNP